MDYEQDYSKLTSSDNHWYMRRGNQRFNAHVSTEDEAPSTTVLTLDNEDFD